MSVLENLRPRRHSTHRARRVGRGDSSGWGGTAGRGHKGQKARKSGGIRRGFEGGQSPIILRLPKFGFSRAWARQHYSLVHVSQLVGFEGEVTPETLQRAGLVKASDLKRGYGVKVLMRGRRLSAITSKGKAAKPDASTSKAPGGDELKKTLVLKVHKISKAARGAVEKAGGRVELIS